MSWVDIVMRMFFFFWEDKKFAYTTLTQLPDTSRGNVVQENFEWKMVNCDWEYMKLNKEKPSYRRRLLAMYVGNNIMLIIFSKI